MPPKTFICICRRQGPSPKGPDPWTQGRGSMAAALGLGLGTCVHGSGPLSLASVYFWEVLWEGVCGYSVVLGSYFEVLWEYEDILGCPGGMEGLRGRVFGDGWVCIEEYSPIHPYRGLPDLIT